MPKAGLISAGIVLWRRREGALEVLLGHPGGPFFAKKDDWSVLKGEVEAGRTFTRWRVGSSMRSRARRSTLTPR